MYSVTVANGIFVSNNFNLRKEYEDAVKNVYQSEIQQKNFAHNSVNSAKEINE